MKFIEDIARQFKARQFKAAAKFSITRIDKVTAYNFIRKYHYLADAKFFATYCYAVMMGDVMLGCATFSDQQGTMARKGWVGDEVPNAEIQELSRLCVLPCFNGTNLTSFLLGRSIRALKATPVRVVTTLACATRHVGSIYQVCNFEYYGLTNKKSDFYGADGTLNARGTTKDKRGVWLPRDRKHRYAYKIDKTIEIKYSLCLRPTVDSVAPASTCCGGTYKVFDSRYEEYHPCPKCKQVRREDGDMKFIGLDVETARTGDNPSVYALQPWRALEGSAEATALAIAKTDGSKALADTREGMQKLLDLAAHSCNLEGAGVVTWNGIFDVSWIIASRLRGKDIYWMDAMLLWKAVDNSQLTEMHPAWSLAAGVKRWCADEPWAAEFLDMKSEQHEAGEDPDYWKYRCKMDAYATACIAEKAWACLSPKKKKACLTESQCLAPVAMSWVRGIRLDVAGAATKAPVITDEMRSIEIELDVITEPNLNLKSDRNRTITVSDGGKWMPSKVLSSPRQLGILLFGDLGNAPKVNFNSTESWGLKPKDFSEKTELPSTDKTALTYLADKDDRVLSILRWKELNTQYTKFIKGIANCSEYLQSETAHPQPKLASTYTRRMTYKSKSGSKGEAAKAKIGVALHQWPRPKELRKLILPPKGKVLGELDAMSQESRLMAIFSRDKNMLDVFHNNKDFHSNTGAAIAGMSYDAFIKGKEQGLEAIVGPQGLRMAGKFTGLSNNYRIGIKTLRIRARVNYGLDIDYATATKWQQAFFREYPAIKDYWREAIITARERGYAESLGGSRFRLDFFGDPDSQWGTESSAINFPIQATGAEMKELAVATLAAKHPTIEYAMDLHDALFVYLDEGDDIRSTMLELRDTLDSIDYEEAWDWTPPIPLTWECEAGKSWGDMQVIGD